jgi:hypothetical protein
MKPIHFFVPFDAIERADKRPGVFDEDGLLPGYAFVNEVVEGEGGMRLLRSSMEAATPDWMKFGNVREMHTKNAAGVALHAEWDPLGLFVRSDVVDPVAKLKVERGVYKGYSVGVQPLAMRGLDVTECKIIELSLVDRPKDPESLFTAYRAVDAEEEAEVEILDPGFLDVDAAVARQAAVDAEAAKERADQAAPAAPAADQAEYYRIEEAATGMFILYGEDGQKLGEFETMAEAEARRAELMAAFTPSAEVGPDGVPLGPNQMPHQPIHVDNEQARVADTQHPTPDTLPEERGQTSETVPSRENLEGKVAKVAPGADTAIERYIREEDGKWCLYSEEGKKLGEYDTKEEAVKRLRQIEGHKDDGRRVRGEDGEALNILRCGCCGMDMQLDLPGGAVAMEVPSPSFAEQLRSREGGQKASLAWNILRDVLWQIAWVGGDGAEGHAREAVGQFAEYVAPIIGQAGQQQQRAELFAPFTRAADGDGDEKPKGDYGSHDEAGYADPGLQSDKKPRYPLKEDGKLSSERVHAAWSYINQSDNAAKYSSDDLAKVKGRIKAAAKEVGMEISDEERLETLSDDALLRLAALETDNASLILRAETAEGELARVLETREALTRDLDLAKEQIVRLENEPVPNTPVQFPKAFDREFYANVRRGQDAVGEAILARLAEIAALPATTDVAEQQRRVHEMQVLKMRLGTLD